MLSPVSLEDARRVLADDLLGPDEVAAAFGGAQPPAPPIPFARDELTAARARGEMLVLRLAQVGDGQPLTLMHMLRHAPDAFDQKLLRQVGYQLKDEWGIELEPLAQTDTCTAGWALAAKAVLPETCNRAYDEQEPLLRRYAEVAGPFLASWRRRTAVEAVYDTLLYFTTRRVRLLEKTWDWTASRTLDGGYLHVGGFGPGGMQILAFSRAIRHGALGLCPTRQETMG